MTLSEAEPIKESFKIRWLATLITLPLSLMFLVLGLLSTGAGHGTSAIFKFLYSPLFLFRNIVSSFLNFLGGGLFIGMTLCVVFHLIYSALADYLKNISYGIIYFAVLLLFYNGLFIYSYLTDIEDQEKFARAYDLDPTFLVIPIVLFICWQVFLLLWVYYGKRFNTTEFI